MRRKTIYPKGCVVIVPNLVSTVATATARAVLDGFRQAFYDCLTARADALFELCDAVLCADGPVTSLAELSLAGVHRRGHGALYDGLAQGRVELDRLRMALAGLELPRGPGGRLVIAVDVTPWPRPDAVTSPDRVHCHQHCTCRAGSGGRGKTVPGWPYQVAAALGVGRTSWTAPLDVVRLGPHDDATEVTASQIREVTARLVTAGHHQPGDPPVVFVLDAGYDLPRLQHLLTDLPIELLGRIRSDRVLYTRAAPRPANQPGPQARHGTRFKCTDPTTWPTPEHQTTHHHDRYGQVHTQTWQRLHPKLAARYNWADHHDRELPIIEATITQVTVDRLPGDRSPKPLWLWYSHADPTPTDIDLLWRTYLRRFDLEHTFRLLKQTLGLTRPRVRTTAQADRWAWLLITAYTQLRLARTLVADLRRPWEKPPDPDRLTPGRTRRGFRHLQPIMTTPARPPKPTHPGPGRPKGATSQPAPRHPTTKKPNKRNTPRRANTQPKG